MSDRKSRLEEVNMLLIIIGRYGRRFFYNKSHDRFAQFILKNGRLYFVDDYTGKEIYTHNTGFRNTWRGFSHGGTLKSLCHMLRDFIVHGKGFHIDYIGCPRKDGTLQNNIWGYDEESINTVRSLCADMSIFND